jgi:16S rRNA (uracil1498-N3)-methyltransferase
LQTAHGATLLLSLLALCLADDSCLLCRLPVTRLESRASSRAQPYSILRRVKSTIQYIVDSTSHLPSMLSHRLPVARLVLRRCSRGASCIVPHAGSPPRLYAHPLSEGSVELSAEESRHATKALRLREGDPCELFDGLGRLARGRIARVDVRGGALVETLGTPMLVPWTGCKWHVAVACTGLGSRADWCIEKCTELGVHTFTPLLTERSSSRQQRREEPAEHARWTRLAAAASKQSLRLHSMAIAASTQLSDLIRDSVNTGSLVALQGGQPLRTVLQAEPGQRDAGSRLLVVGPPGDFTEEEKRALTQAGAIAVGLGDLRLRTETAAVALVSACLLI